MHAIAECQDARDDAMSDATRETLVNDEAQELLLTDTDTFADWLYSHCIGVKREHTRLRIVPRDDVRRMQFIESLDVPQLAAVLLQPDKKLAGEACWELRNRYIDAQRDYLAKLAATVEIE